MLSGLGRWLRVAGYDTALIEIPQDDREILQQAINENRILLTCDRHFKEMQVAPNSVIFLSNNGIEECAIELKKLFNLNWLHAPFSRCLECNSPLEEPNEKQVDEQVPNDIRFSSEPFSYCPQCQKVYWKGSHTTRMLKQLEAWQQWHNH